MRDWRDALLPQIAQPFRRLLERLPGHIAAQTREIRVRAERPFSIMADEEAFIGESGICRLEDAYLPKAEDCKALLEAMCGHSVYAHEEEIRKGYLSLRGGFRCGLSGRATVENGRVTNLSHICGFAIRIAKAIPGAARAILPHALDGGRVRSVLIISPPGLGKTTMLRDLVRLVSDSGVQAAVVDERGEIAACWQGVPQLDMGLRTDVLDACPKAEGIRMAIRSLSPRVVATDEIGSPEEAGALCEAANSGVAVFATAHARDYKECKARLGAMVNGFERIAVLGGDRPGQSVIVINAADGGAMRRVSGGSP